MEEWENLLETYKLPSEANDFSKILRTAEFTLSKDLAPFEIEHFLTTLLKEPVSLIDLIKHKSSDTTWAKLISDSLKMLSGMVVQFKMNDEHLRMIVEVCTLSYDAQTNQYALQCLSSVTTRSQIGVCDINRYLYALEFGTTCKAQLATYIGTVCEHHPDRVADNINTIWRTFLNLLDTGKYSIPVVKAVLEAVRGMLKHFGNELPTMELNLFYDKLVPCIELQRCTEVCTSILGGFPELFRERLCRDRSVRARLWSLAEHAPAQAALRYAYTQMDARELQNVIQEVTSNVESSNIRRRLTALGVVGELRGREVRAGDVADHVHLPELEFKLRSGTVSYETADTIAWCIEAHVYHSDRLLKAALATYETIPAGRRRQLAVHGLLRCATGMLPDVIEFLILETCRAPNKYMQIWKEVFDNKDGTDQVVVENSGKLLKVFSATVCFILDGVAADAGATQELINLLRLVFSVLQCTRQTCCGMLAQRLLRWSRRHSEAVPAAVLACSGSKDQPVININTFGSDVALINCCTALVTVPDASALPAVELLKFLQILFSWHPVDAAVLTAAVHKLARLVSRDVELDELILNDIFWRIRKIVDRKREGKQERILRRDAIQLFGKLGTHDDVSIHPDAMIMSSLRESLYLTIPEDTGNIKIYLNRVLHVGVVEGRVSACGALAGVLCAALSNRKEAALQSALYRVLAVLCRCPADADADLIRYYVTRCDPKTAPEFVKLISKVTSPDSRGLLLEGLETLLTAEPPDEQLLEEVMELILLNDILINNNSEILETLLKVLKNNNVLLQQYALKIIYKAIKCNEKLTALAADTIIDKIELFNEETINNVIFDVYKSTLHLKYGRDDEILNILLRFIKILMEKNKHNFVETISSLIKIEPVNFFVLSCVKHVFELTEEQCKTLYTQNKINIEKYILEDDITFDLGAKLEFLVDFSWPLNKDVSDNFINNIIKNLTPKRIVQFENGIQKFLKYTSDSENVDVKIVRDKLYGWVGDLPLAEIAGSLENYTITSEHEDVVYALKLVIECSGIDGLVLSQVENLKKILYVTLKLFVSGYIERCLQNKMQCMNDLVEVSMAAATCDDLKGILEGADNAGVQFVQTFITGAFGRLTTEPYLLLEPRLQHAAVLLNDVVKLAARRREVADVLDLVDKLWSTYSRVATFSQIQSVLVDLSWSETPMPPDSSSAGWLLASLQHPDTATHERILLVEAIPKGEESWFETVTQRLPTRLDEMSASVSSYFQAILESFAKNKSRKLLEVIVNLSAGTDTHGWWDRAFEATVSTLAADEDLALCQEIYQHCWEGSSLGACTRILVPLLRFSKAAFCEEFYSSILPNLVTMLESSPRSASDHYSYHKYLVDCTRAFVLVELLFQKVPRQCIESPNSGLYQQMRSKVNDVQFWIVKSACKLGVTLRSNIRLPDGANQKTKDIYRLFHCSIFNCMAAALSCRDPGVDVYKIMFDKKTWSELIGTQPLDLPLQQIWTRRGSAPAPHAPALQQRLTATTLTRDFTRTLSEDPLLYDLPDVQVQPVEVAAVENPLTRHECWSALVGLLHKVAPQRPNPPLELLAAALIDTDLHGNVKWLLVQAVCHCGEELRPHASALRPALLDVLAAAPDGVLNCVHIDIVDTILEWHDGALPTSCVKHVDTMVQHLLSTAVEHSSASAYRTLLEKIRRVVEVYADGLTIKEDLFKEKITDLKSEKPKRCVQVLKQIAKAKVRIPELIPAMMQLVQERRQSPDVLELLGLALANDEHNTKALLQFRNILKQRRTDMAEYIKMLYYTQRGHPEICDEHNFRVVSELITKIVGRERLRCVEIVAGYVRSGAAEREGVEALPLRELAVEGVGLELLKHSLPLISEGLRKDLVMHVVKHCRSPTKERSSAYGVLLRAFELLVKPEPSEPLPKRRVECSAIINSLHAGDEYAATVLGAVGDALLMEDMDTARAEVGELLSVDASVRFCEAFILALHYPIKFGNISNIRRALGTCLTLFFGGVRRQEQYRRTAMSAAGGDGNTSRTPSHAAIENLPQTKILDSNVKSLVTQTVDQVLDELLEYSMLNQSVAVALCSQLMVQYRGTTSPGLTFDETVYDVLTAALETTCAVTPHVMELMVALGYWTPSLKGVVEELVQVCVGSEGQELSRVFREEWELHALGAEHLVLGSVATEDDMETSASTEFNITALVSAFDALSDWDSLTLQRRSELTTSLPPLFVDNETFTSALRDFTDGPLWFKNMVSVYRGEDVDQSQCYRQCSRWPRRSFDTSAMFEALDWQKMRIGADDDVQHRYHVRTGECVAKWSARIMLRRAFEVQLGVSSSSTTDVLELSRCALRHLPDLTRACCDTLTNLKENETLTLRELHISSLRCLAVETGDAEYVQSALQGLEQFKNLVSLGNNPEHLMHLAYQTLLLNRDVEFLSKAQLGDIINDVTVSAPGVRARTAADASAAYALAITQLDRHWEKSDISERDDVIKFMCKMVNADLELGVEERGRQSLDFVTSRLEEYGSTLNEDTASCLLNLIKRIPEIDEFTVSAIKSSINKFPDHMRAEVLLHLQADDETMEKMKKCFQLVVDAEHLLRDYCRRLGEAMRNNDELLYKQTLASIREKIFDNPYAGADHRVLLKYRNTLEENNTFEPHNEDVKRRLTEIEIELKSEKSSLLLSQLCPTLTREWNEKEHQCVSKLLGLRQTAHGVQVPRVHRLENTVGVFCGALRRPALVAARLSDGSVRRVLVKSGEPVRRHAAAVRALRTIARTCPPGDTTAGYTVTIVSDDCGIIEFLEDRVRLRSMVEARHPINDVLQSVQRSASAELILSPRNALQQYRRICDGIPATLLRSAIQSLSVSMEDFIKKKRNFLETLSTTTIATALLGVGDRHLENVLYSVRSGGVCHVDWAGALQYGGRELPAARLTRNVVAVGDVRVLESKLQSLMSELQRNSRLVLASFKVSFKWMGDEFNKKCRYFEGLLERTMLLHQVTADVIQHSSQQYRQKYVELIAEVFHGFPQKEKYTVVDQISSMLRLSTEPRLLCVVRSGWEPWI